METGDEEGAIDFDKIIGQTYKLILNNTFYRYDGTKFIPNSIPNTKDAMIPANIYNHVDNLELKIVGIVRPNPQTEIGSVDSGAILAYSPELTEYLFESSLNSEIVNWMKQDENILKDPLTGAEYQPDDERTVEEKRANDLIKYGGIKNPTDIIIYPKNFEAKNLIKEYLDEYNEEQRVKAINEYYESIGKTPEQATDEERKQAEARGKAAGVYYVDLMEVLVTSLNTLVNAISIVLIVFTSISLVVSSIMIGIITYISVLERTKEIGILRSVGARKKDISRVFNAETLIIGFTAGLIGILITAIISIPANIILYKLVDINNLVLLNPLHAIILIIISMGLTLIAGLIPSGVAARKDPVIALRTE